jgi:hypothetical protein
VTDLAELREALKKYDEQSDETSPWYIPEWVRELADAARVYADLLENGRQVDWCEEHRQFVVKTGESCAWSILADALLTAADVPKQYSKSCLIVSKLLIEVPYV